MRSDLLLAEPVPHPRHRAPGRLLTSIPLFDVAFLSELPEGPRLLRSQREVEAASRAFEAISLAGGSVDAARIRLRKAVFAHVRACRRWLVRHDPLRVDRGRSQRVDFSAVGAVAPDPSLGLDRCGLPIEIAFELF